MAGANVEIESVKKIKYGLQKLQNAANKGFSECEKALSSVESEIQATYQRGWAKVSLLESEISRLEREADAKQADYDRQLREYEEARAQGKPYSMDAYGPDSMRRNATEKREQLEELKIELENLKKQITSYKTSKEEFVTAFKKIASGGGGGDNDQMASVLEKTISALDSYVHTSFSSDGCSSYDAFSARMQATNAQNAAFTMRMTETAMRSHQDFVRQQEEEEEREIGE